MFLYLAGISNRETDQTKNFYSITKLEENKTNYEVNKQKISVFTCMTWKLNMFCVF